MLGRTVPGNGSPTAIATSGIELALGRSFEHNFGNWFIIGYAALFPSTLAYLAWNVAVPVVGPNLAAITQYLNPVFAITLAALILGETVKDFHLAGIATILLGIYLSGRRRNRGEPNE